MYQYVQYVYCTNHCTTPTPRGSWLSMAIPHASTQALRKLASPLDIPCFFCPGSWHPLMCSPSWPHRKLVSPLGLAEWVALDGAFVFGGYSGVWLEFLYWFLSRGLAFFMIIFINKKQICAQECKPNHNHTQPNWKLDTFSLPILHSSYNGGIISKNSRSCFVSKQSDCVGQLSVPMIFHPFLSLVMQRGQRRKVLFLSVGVGSVLFHNCAKWSKPCSRFRLLQILVERSECPISTIPVGRAGVGFF